MKLPNSIRGLFCLLVICLYSVKAQSVPGFTAVRGQREFSGRLIVRPLQMPDAAARGLSEAQARVLGAVARREAAALGIEREFPEVEEWLVRVPPGQTENGVAARLMATGAFSYAEPDWILFPVECSNDPQLSQQWHHAADRLNSCGAWAYATGSPSIVVAICDTGIRVTHQDLLLNRVEGFHVPSRTWEGNGGPIDDINGHGTLCTGAAAANGNNGIGVVGMGWNIGHRMMRVTDSTDGSASLSSLTLAARTAADRGDRVASVSYSGVNNSSVFTTGDYVRSKGGLLVWAAGNSNVELSGNRDDKVIVVGATDQNDAKASFSNFGSLVDLVAPGVGIRTTSRSGDAAYSSVSGTSFSTPIVAGLCALIWSRNPDLTPAEVESILRSTCKDLGAAGVDSTFGYGRVDAAAALAATPGVGVDTTPPSAPTSLAAAAGDGLVELTWNPSPENDVAGYSVYRSGDGSNYTLVTPLLVSGTGWLDDSVVNGLTYSYFVTATDLSGNQSPASVVVWATPVEPPPYVVVFADGFESGNLTAGGWTRQNADAFASKDLVYSGAWGVRLRKTTWIEKAVSTAGLGQIEVSYARRTQGLAAGQALVVEWWNGSVWSSIESVTATAYQAVTYLLPAGADNKSSFRLRFRLNGNNNNRRADVDAVVVTGVPLF